MTYADFENFIRVWQQSGSIHEACRLLHLDLRDASNHAAHLRRAGVPLKKMKHSGCRLRSEWLTAVQYRQLAALARACEVVEVGIGAES